MRTFDGPPMRPSRKRRLSHKGKEPEEAGGLAHSSGVATSSRVPSGSVSRRRVRKDETEKSDQQDSLGLRQRRRRNLHQLGVSVSDKTSLDNANKFEFTFRSPTRFPQDKSGFSRRSVSEPPSATKFSAALERGPELPRVLTPSPMAPAFPAVALERPSGTLPFVLVKRNSDDDQGGPSDTNSQPSLDGSQDSSSFREARM